MLFICSAATADPAVGALASASPCLESFMGTGEGGRKRGEAALGGGGFVCLGLQLLLCMTGQVSGEI